MRTQTIRHRFDLACKYKSQEDPRLYLIAAAVEAHACFSERQMEYLRSGANFIPLSTIKIAADCIYELIIGQIKSLA